MRNIDFWKLCDQLSIVHAALLVAGHDPSDHQTVESEYLNNQPKGYDGAKHAIISGLRKGTLEGELKYAEPYNGDGEPYICVQNSYAEVESLKAWLITKNLTHHFFFFPEAKVGEFHDRNHPRYSQKLSAAITAWQWLDTEEKLEGKTPKQALQKWLRKHASEYGICDDEGKPVETVIESIAQIVNWRTKGGAPRTSPQEKQIEPYTNADIEMSVSDPSKPVSDNTCYDMDDIPF